MEHKRVLQAIADIKAGKMVVMTDDEDRENEGDVVFAAAFSDTEKINFMIKEARGVLCTPLTTELARKFELAPMVSANSSAHETAFTVSIDATAASTGVSAAERDMTVRLLVGTNTSAADFVRPGHIFPLIAKHGGVLERTGHTEGSIDLCLLAGVAPVAVICEIVKDDGQMARKADLEAFCAKWGLNMVSVSDIIKYRLKHEKLISVSEPNGAILAGFECDKYEITDHLGGRHFAFVFGELGSKAAVKFHKIASDLELLESAKFAEFSTHLAHLKACGGIAIFMASGGGAKHYGIGAQILKHFKLSDIELLRSSDGELELVGLEGFGLNIV